MSRQESHSYRWNGTEWAIATNSSITQTNEPIRIATLNILADCFPFFVEMTIRSTERYEWLCKGIIDLNPTILGLNEVTTNALERLKQCSFIRENYFITELLNENKKLLFPHACVLLSKLPFIEVFAISVSGRKREAIVGKIQLGQTKETCAYICSHHATPYQAEKNADLRSQQIRDIMSILEPLNQPFIIMGDLNLYHDFEDAVVLDNRLTDAWAQTHFSDQYPFNDKDLGYTFDALKNTLIPYYVPGSCDQMRLDRILFSYGFPALAIVPCVLWANEAIKSDNYLFPSDHFGLSIDIVLEKTSEMAMMPLNKSDPTAEQVLRHNVENNDDERLNRVGIFRKTKAWTAHAFWLGGRALGLK